MPALPPSRHRRRPPAHRAAAVLLGAASLVTACGSGSSGGPPITVVSPSARSDFRGASLSPPSALPAVTLTDTAGAPWPLAARAAGRVTVVYFGYTHCPDVCPTDMADLATARRSLPADLRAKVDVVFVTVDVRRDTPTVIRTWLDRFDPALVGLTGTPQALAAAAKAVGIRFQVRPTTAGLEEVEHSSQMTAFSPDGLSRLAWLDGTPVADISHDLRLLASGRVPT